MSDELLYIGLHLTINGKNCLVTTKYEDANVIDFTIMTAEKIDSTNGFPMHLSIKKQPK